MLLPLHLNLSTAVDTTLAAALSASAAVAASLSSDITLEAALSGSAGLVAVLEAPSGQIAVGALRLHARSRVTPLYGTCTGRHLTGPVRASTLTRNV